jgi:Ser/Thr protein kinase RdoA (MazF antagonist)
MDKSFLSQIAPLYSSNMRESKQILDGEISRIYSYKEGGRTLLLRAVRGDLKLFRHTLAEVDFVLYLVNHGVSASKPIPSKNGKLAEHVVTDRGQFVMAVFEKAEGQVASLDKWNPILWEKIGMEMGRMHRLTKNYEPPSEEVRRPHWHEADIMDPDNLIPKDQSYLREKAQGIIQALQKLPKDNDSYGLIHSDLNRGNLFLRDDKITIFDFEDCEYHWFVNDIAIALYFAVEDSFNGSDIKSYVKDFLQSLLKGYKTENRLDPVWFEHIPLFHQLRELLTLLYFYRDTKKLNEDQIALTNRCRINLENDRPFLPYNFAHLIRNI